MKITEKDQGLKVYIFEISNWFMAADSVGHDWF